MDSADNSKGKTVKSLKQLEAAVQSAEHKVDSSKFPVIVEGEIDEASVVSRDGALAFQIKDISVFYNTSDIVEESRLRRSAHYNLKIRAECARYAKEHPDALDCSRIEYL